MRLYLHQSRVIALDAIGTFKMCFRCTATEEPSKVKSPQIIKKFHINYQPSKKMKSLLKNGVPVLKDV